MPRVKERPCHTTTSYSTESDESKLDEDPLEFACYLGLVYVEWILRRMTLSSPKIARLEMVLEDDFAMEIGLVYVEWILRRIRQARNLQQHGFGPSFSLILIASNDVAAVRQREGCSAAAEAWCE
ncbi:unnamed protein product [Linum trigynum]|uniref:Uncharacterized protein n=1 Tax=Linum trigynum TaxID=586398 RepID=A0AAV2FED0_9ROSI